MSVEALASQLSDANLRMESTIGKARALTWSLLHALNDSSEEGDNAAHALAECLSDTLAAGRK